MGLYYLDSRYYDPEIGRFINADGQISGVGGNILGYNMFAYCFNNPINMDDPSGNWPKWVKKIGSTIKNTVKKAVSKAVKKVKKATNSIKLSFPVANYVSKAHATTPTAMLNLGTAFGKIGFSATVTEQNKNPGLLHSYSDIDSNRSQYEDKYAIGINVVGWLGADC